MQKTDAACQRLKSEDEWTPIKRSENKINGVRQSSSWTKSASSSCSSRAGSATDNVQWENTSKDWSLSFTRRAVSVRATVNGLTCQMTTMTKTITIPRSMGKTRHTDRTQRCLQAVIPAEIMCLKLIQSRLWLHWNRNAFQVNLDRTKQLDHRCFLCTVEGNSTFSVRFPLHSSSYASTHASRSVVVSACYSCLIASCVLQPWRMTLTGR